MISYRIRLPTEKEREGLVSKEVRSLWDYETALLRFYQVIILLLSIAMFEYVLSVGLGYSVWLMTYNMCQGIWTQMSAPVPVPSKAFKCSVSVWS